MSRSGYSDDVDPSRLALYRATVQRAIDGARGQAFLRRMIKALDSLPTPELCDGGLVTPDGVCAMGAIAVAEGLDVSKVDPDERDQVAELFGIAPSLAAEVAYENDEGYFGRGDPGSEDPGDRFYRMRRWAESHVKEPA